MKQTKKGFDRTTVRRILHDLRHYLVSVMLSLNIPKMYIADYVGHADEHMIDTVYGHIMASKKGMEKQPFPEKNNKNVY